MNDITEQDIQAVQFLTEKEFELLKRRNRNFKIAVETNDVLRPCFWLGLPFCATGYYIGRLDIGATFAVISGAAFVIMMALTIIINRLNAGIIELLTAGKKRKDSE